MRGRLFLLLVLSIPGVCPLAVNAAGDNAPLQVTMVPPEGDGVKYWPTWRGPSGQGLVPDGAYPDKWSETDNVLWKVELPGRGNSTPVLWKDRIFLTVWKSGKERGIASLNRADGKLLWQTNVPEHTTEKIQNKNGYSSGSTATDGQHVYAYFGNAGVLCVDFAGKQVWHHPFKEMDAYHGMACTPLLYKDKVILFQDHKSAWGSFVIALDKLTGKELWKTARKEKVGWSSPIAIRVKERDYIIVSSQDLVYAYDPADGKEVWRCKGNNYEVIPQPVVGHGLLYCCSGRTGPTLAIRPEGAGDITAKNIVWKKGTGSPFVPSPLLYGDYLYMMNDIVSVCHCHDAKTGKPLWQERLGQPVKEGFSASPIGVNGKVFFTNDQGETYVLKAGPKFELLHINRLPGPLLASPALLEGMWYIRSDRHLYCIGQKS